MKQYLNDLKCYIESVVFWADEQNTDDKELLSGYAIDSLYHIIDANELGSIAEEIDEKLKGKTYKK